VGRRVHAAIDALGPPPYPRRVEVLPAIAPGTGTDELLERFRETSAELEAALPAELESAVHEAFWLEVRTVAQHVAELGALFEQMHAGRGRKPAYETPCGRPTLGTLRARARGRARRPPTRIASPPASPTKPPVPIVAASSTCQIGKAM